MSIFNNDKVLPAWPWHDVNLHRVSPEVATFHYLLERARPMSDNRTAIGGIAYH